MQRKESMLRAHQAGELDAFSRMAILDVQELLLSYPVDVGSASSTPHQQQQQQQQKGTGQPPCVLPNDEKKEDAKDSKSSESESKSDDKEDDSEFQRAVRYLHGCGAIWSSQLGSITAAAAASSSSSSSSSSSPFVILQPMSWFTQILSFFVGDMDRIRIPNHEGVIEWSDIRDHMLALGCNDESELRRLIFVLHQIGLCLPLRLRPRLRLRLRLRPRLRADDADDAEDTEDADDGANARPSQYQYLFPCLLPAAKVEDMDSRWYSKMANSMSFGRRISCSAKHQAFPASLFPAIQFAMASDAKLVGGNYSFVMYQGVILLELSPSTTSADSKLQALIRLSAKHDHIDVVVRWPSYSNLKDEQRGRELFLSCMTLCNKILALLRKYEGLQIRLSALCPTCLIESRLDSPLQALPLVLRKKKDPSGWARDWRYTASSWIVSKKYDSPITVHGVHSAPRDVLSLGYQRKFDSKMWRRRRLLLGSFTESQAGPFDLSQYPRPAAAGLSEEKKFVFFLSHRGPDTKDSLVAPLSWILNELKIPHFFDRAMQVGQESVPQMAHAAWSCRVGVVIISHGFIESDWCLKELNTFLTRHHAHPTEFDVFPVFYDPLLLRSAEYASLTRFSCCLRDMSHGAFDFLGLKLLPELLNFPPIQTLPCIQECHRKMASDPSLLLRLCKRYYRQQSDAQRPFQQEPTPSCCVL